MRTGRERSGGARIVVASVAVMIMLVVACHGDGPTGPEAGDVDRTLVTDTTYTASDSLALSCTYHRNPLAG